MYAGGVTTGTYRHAINVHNTSNSSVPSTGRQRKRPPNCGSRLLSNAENAVLFALLGHDCISLAAGVVQLLKSEPSRIPTWVKFHIGVVSLVKDYEKRAYFLRLYDIHRKQFLWQQMLYKKFRASSTSCPNLLIFEGDDCIFGLNFSSQEEADNFLNHLEKRYEQERNSLEKEMIAGAQDQAGSGMHGSAIVHGSRTVHAQSFSMPHITGITSIGTVPNVGGSLANLVAGGRIKKKSKKEKKQKIRKEDISNPTNFQHKAHLGWNQEGGFSQETFDCDPMDDSVRDILRAAGQNPDRMTKDDIEFSRKFISKYQKVPVMQQVPTAVHHNHTKSYVSTPSPATMGPPPPPPPPPPLRREVFLPAPISRPPQRPPVASSKPPARPLPQPPGLTNGSSYRPSDTPPPLPSQPAVSIGEIHQEVVPPSPPPLPPTAVNSSSAPAPPPPPPPPPPADVVHAPPITNARANLLSEIQAGIALKPVVKSTAHGNGFVSRNDVMAQIRQGTNLKPVEKESTENRKPGPVEMGGIAGALARALEERRRNIRNSDDSEDEDEENNDSEWESD